MGKKRAAVLGSDQEESLKAEKAVKREQKKLREGQTVKKSSEKEAAPVMEQTAPEVETKSTSPKKDHHRSKAYQTAKSAIDSNKVYSIDAGLTLLRKVSLTKFDSTVELHIVLKKAPEAKLSVNLPHNTKAGKKVSLVTDELLAKLESGNTNLDLDFIVATPAQMGKLVKFAKVLGPKGLMPNPKTGTVSEKPEEAAKKLAADTSMALKIDKSAPVIHTTVGKLSLKDDQLQENIQAILTLLPGNLKKIVLKSTMSPAIKLQA